MKILEEFWYGNIQPNERDIIPNSRFAKLLKLVTKNEENLAPMLSEDAKAVFEKLRDCQDELSSVSECNSFVLGFRLISWNLQLKIARYKEWGFIRQ